MVLGKRESCLMRASRAKAVRVYLPTCFSGRPAPLHNELDRGACVRACVNKELSPQQDRTSHAVTLGIHLRSAGHKHVSPIGPLHECCPTSLSCNERHVTSETTRKKRRGARPQGKASIPPVAGHGSYSTERGGVRSLSSRDAKLRHCSLHGHHRSSSGCPLRLRDTRRIGWARRKGGSLRR